MDNVVQIAEELVAFSNAEGGIIIVGVKDNGTVVGLEAQEVRKTNLNIANAASENVLPPVFPKTQVMQLDNKTLLLIQVEKGLQRPYQTKQGKYLTKAGSDKRILATEEMKRMILSKSVLFEELPIAGTSLAVDFSLLAFASYFQKVYQMDYVQFLEEENQNLEQLLQNLKLTDSELFTLAGLLFFTRNPQRLRPLYVVRAVAFYGNELEDEHYLSSENIEGTLPEQFERCMVFVKQHLRKVQNGKSFNSTGDLEVPAIVFEELLVNALLHRDYAINSAVRLLVFKNRIEI
ncbi:MAG: putative DNA binding domain-containing protein, partial [Spirosomaceae bacterium]|nr:putative DNA binding domain-containing protein [Spirosomataceae bacterium]